MVLSVTLMLGTTVFAKEADISTKKKTLQEEIDQYVSEQYYQLSTSEHEKLARDIYMEKYEISSINLSDEAEEDNSDEAYENMITRENYIVDLISRYSGQETSREEWENNLQYLKSHYDEIIALENINRIYVDLYIEDYEIVEATKNMPESQINEIRTRSSSYSYSDAVTYAKKYYSSYNSAYPDWTSYGGDCANFISQCLYAGGKNMKGTPGTSDAAQNWENWFSKGSSCNTKNVSSTWRGANAFKSYWQGKASGYRNFSSVGSSSYSYGFTGDDL